MALLQLQSQIQLNKEMVTVEVLLQELEGLDAKQYVFVFQNANLFLPRQLRMDVLRRILEPHVKKTRQERYTLADELNYRLKWFYQYSDSQYVNLLSFYNDVNLNQTYIEQLLIAIFEYLVEHKKQDLIQQLREARKSLEKPFDFKDINHFNQELNVVFIDKKEEIDGLTLKLIRPVLLKGSTLQELKIFGEKYGIVVPRRLKKEQLLEVIFLELNTRGLLTEDLKQELQKKSVVLIQRYAVDHGIKVSTELKKDEIIEYILEFSHQTKDFYTSAQPEDYALEIDDPFIIENSDKPVQVQPQKAPNNVIPIESSTKKEKQVKVNKTEKEHIESNLKTPDEAKEVVKTDGVPLVLDRQTAKFLKLYAVSKKQKLILLPDKKHYKKRRKFKVQLDQMNDIKPTKKKHGLIGELLVLKFFGLILLRTFLFLFATALVLGLLFVGYATASYFLNIDILNTLNEQINAFEILGKGILDHLFDFYRQIGI